jgi:hypothetical protein
MTGTKWETVRYIDGVDWRRKISHRKLDVPGTGCYLVVKAEYHEWTWKVFDRTKRNALGESLLITTGNEPTLQAAKAAALAALGAALTAKHEEELRNAGR